MGVVRVVEVVGVVRVVTVVRVVGVAEVVGVVGVVEVVGVMEIPLSTGLHTYETQALLIYRYLKCIDFFVQGKAKL